MRIRTATRLCSALTAWVVVAALAAAPAVASHPLVWEKTHNSGTPETSAIDIATDPGNGNVYVLARDDCCPLSSYDTLAYSSTGTLLWHHASSTAEDLPAGLAVDAASHDVIVTGSRNLNTHSLYTIDYKSTGAVRWATSLTGTGRDISTAGIADDGHGRVVITGTSSAGGVGDYLTVAYRIADGTLLWHIRYDGPLSEDDEAVAVATDPAKSLAYVTGTSQGTNFGELTTVAYATNNGTQKWVARDTGDDDVPKGIAVDPTNHQVYALTYTAGGHMAVFAYSSGGSALWNSGDNNPHAVGGFPQAIAVDPGNHQVYVTGDNQTVSTTQSLLAGWAADGTLAWSTVVHHGTNDIPWDVAVDSSNHRIYVAVEQDTSAGVHEFGTYAETSAGASAWSATHAGSGSNAAAPATITADAAHGQVYISGYKVKAGVQLLDTIAYAA